MVSGTLAHKKRAEAAKVARSRKLKAAADKSRALDKNREDVVAEVCALFGWKELDPFAKEMINNAFAGKLVDIKQLRNDIEAWKKAQETTVEEAEAKEAITEKEETVNGDISVQ